MHYILVLLVGIAVCDLDIRSKTPQTVVSLFDKGLAPKHPGVFPEWSQAITIGGKRFDCSLSQDKEMERQHAIRDQRIAILSPLKGYCDSVSGITVCPNKQISLPDGTMLKLSEKVSHTSLGFQVFLDPSSQHVRGIMDCEYEPLKVAGEKKCRAGDALSEYRVITQTFSNSSIAIKSTRSISALPVVVPMESVGCGSVGILSPSDLFRIKSVKPNPDGIFSVLIASPLCGQAPHDLLQPLTGSCLAGEFVHRQFEVCFGNNGIIDFRAVQLVHRLNHPWPSVVPLHGLSNTPEWEYNPLFRSLINEVTTDLNCRSFQPFLSENYHVLISHPRMTLKAVGGPFTPLTFTGDINGVTGTLWFDAAFPKACSDSAYKEHPQGPWIAVAERGECMFQEKALLAQKRGAIGIVIINNVRKGMIPAMAGIPGKPAVDIPAVLVDTDGTVLKQLNGVEAKIQSAPLPGTSAPSPEETMRVKLNVKCTDGMDASPCEIDDQVLVELDGEQMRYPAQIVEKINAELFTVKLEPHKPPIAIPGWQIFKNSDSPCTAQAGTFITRIRRSDTCELTVDIHSALLCADTRFKEPQLHRNDIVCELM